jgi:hypothetical protein
MQLATQDVDKPEDTRHLPSDDKEAPSEAHAAKGRRFIEHEHDVNNAKTLEISNAS